MCFDGSGGHAPPSARHLFPDSAGRSVRLFRSPLRLGQRGIAPLCARPPYLRAPASGRARRAARPPRRRRSAVPPASSPSIALKARAGVVKPSAPRGSEFTCDIASARSAGESRSNLRPAPLGSSFLISTWLRSQAPFWSLRLGSQQDSLVSPGPSPSGSASCSLLGRCSSVSRHAESSRAPSTVSISQAAAHASSPRARNAAACRRPSGPSSRRPSRSSGHGVLRSPGAGRSGPQGIGFPHSSVHVRMNVGGVRMKLIFKGLLR